MASGRGELKDLEWHGFGCAIFLLVSVPERLRLPEPKERLNPTWILPPPAGSLPVTRKPFLDHNVESTRDQRTAARAAACGQFELSFLQLHALTQLGHLRFGRSGNFAPKSEKHLGQNVRNRETPCRTRLAQRLQACAGSNLSHRIQRAPWVFTPQNVRPSGCRKCDVSLPPKT